MSKHSDNEEDNSVDYNSNNLNGKGSPRPKKVLEEKDISDGMNDKEKAKALMEKKEAEQLEEFNIMEEWKKKQEEKLKASAPTNTAKKVIAVV